MVAPPLLAEAAKVTSAPKLRGTAATALGAEGTVAGVALFDGAEAAPVPLTLVARTVNV